MSHIGSPSRSSPSRSKGKRHNENSPGDNIRKATRTAFKLSVNLQTDNSDTSKSNPNPIHDELKRIASNLQTHIIPNHHQTFPVEHIGKLSLTDPIGHGGFGTVFRYEDGVVKVSSKDGISDDIKRELCLYGEQHPHIAQFKKVILLDNNRYGLVFENAGWELFDYVIATFQTNEEKDEKWKLCREHLGYPTDDDSTAGTNKD